jgi:hypothetical protein
MRNICLLNHTTCHKTILLFQRKIFVVENHEIQKLSDEFVMPGGDAENSVEDFLLPFA